MGCGQREGRRGGLLPGTDGCGASAVRGTPALRGAGQGVGRPTCVGHGWSGHGTCCAWGRAVLGTGDPFCVENDWTGNQGTPPAGGTHQRCSRVCWAAGVGDQLGGQGARLCLGDTKPPRACENQLRWRTSIAAKTATSVRPRDGSLPLTMERGSCWCLSSSHPGSAAGLRLGEAVAGRARSPWDIVPPAMAWPQAACPPAALCPPCLMYRHMAQLSLAGPPPGPGCRTEATARAWGRVPDTSNTFQVAEGQDLGGLTLPLSGGSHMGGITPSRVPIPAIVHTQLRRPPRQGKPPSAALFCPYAPHQHKAPMPALLCLCPPWSLAAAPARHAAGTYDTVEGGVHTRTPAQDAPGEQRKLTAHFGKQC